MTDDVQGPRQATATRPHEIRGLALPSADLPWQGQAPLSGGPKCPPAVDGARKRSAYGQQAYWFSAPLEGVGNPAC